MKASSGGEQTLLRVTGWTTHFENNRTRELKIMSWLPIPVKLDGDGYTEILDHERGAAHFGAWIAILEVAAHCETRGTLLRGNRNGLRSPHDATSLARLTRIPVEILSEAIPRLVSVGWISAEPWHVSAGIPQESRTHPAPSCDNPAGSCDLPAPRASRAVLDYRVEESTGESSLAHNSLPPSPLPTTGAGAQDPSRGPGALPPRPPVARASEERGGIIDGDPWASYAQSVSEQPVQEPATFSDPLDRNPLNGGDAQDESARSSRLRREATPPPPSSGRGGAPLPGEEELAALAETLWKRHPQGLRGGALVGTQRALLELLRRGRIRPEDSTGTPESLAFPELDERHAAWCAVWERGEIKPMNLVARWLGQCEFLDPPPVNKAPPRNGNRATQRRWGSDLAPGTTEDDVRRAEEYDRRLLEGN